MATKIQIRRGTASQWTASNPVLSEGELGLESDTGRLKIGNGTQPWNSLAAFSPPVEAFKVGAIYTTTDPTNPGTSLGYGTWASFSTGRILIGVDTGNPSINDPGDMAGSITGTPAGTVSAPTFTGTSSQNTSLVSAGTPAGTNSAPTFTGTSNQNTSLVSAGTPAGTINAHTTAGDSNTTGGTAKVTGPGTHTFTGSAMGTHQHTLTPAGTVSAPTFTGSALGTHQHTLTPAGTVSAPTFTGSSMSILPPVTAVYYWLRTA